MVISENIESTRYDSLLKYYDLHQYRKSQPENDYQPNLNIPNSNSNSVNYNLRHNVAKGLFKGEDFGEDSFLDFVNKFGPDIFVLWKASLLRKRIMLVNMPPMEDSCKYGNTDTDSNKPKDKVPNIIIIVYNIHLLGKVPIQFHNGKNDMIPKFTVGVNDIPELEKRNQSYVACKRI